MKVSLLGTDFASDNRGCGALGYSAIEILKKISMERGDELEVYAVVFRAEPKPQISDVKMTCIEIKPKKMLYWSTCKKVFQQCDFIIDFTGGDSFADIYGFKRFLLASLLKELAISSNAKFIMAPQTIGPFHGKFTNLWAKRIMRKSDICFVRDSLSEEYVKKEFKISPYVTTDVAFALPYTLVKKRETNKIRVGINVSGLLWTEDTGLKTQKNLRLDYRLYITSLVENLVKNEIYEISLIPHVFTKTGNQKENDLRACEELQTLYPQLKICGDFDTPMEAKTMIAQLDVFVGARMHATIASYSTGVATIPVAYSRKFLGLFGDFDYEYIVDMAKEDTQVAVEKTMSWIKDYQILETCIKNNKDKVEEKQRVFYDVIKDL